MAPSAVWAYFQKDKKAGTVTCSKCNGVFKLASTSTLYYHLSHVHFINLKKQPPKGGGAGQKTTVNEEDDDEDNPQELAGPQANLISMTGASTSSQALARPPSGAGAHAQASTATAGAASSSGSTSRSRSFHEGPMDRCLSNATSFSRGGSRNETCTNALLYMLAHDYMPKSTVERDGFRTFVHALQPLYTLPSEPTITVKLRAKYEELKQKIGAELSTAEGLSLAADLWTNKHTVSSYLGVAVHYRKGKDIVVVEIGARPMPERKTTENLRAALRDICHSWQINYEKIRGVVTDGGANIVAAVRAEFGADKHISCVAHRLNLIGQTVLSLPQDKVPSEQGFADAQDDVPEDEEAAVDALDDPFEATDDSEATLNVRALVMKVKKIVRFFRTSDVASTALMGHQLEDGKQPHECLKLLQEVRTRWNSAFYMLDRFLVLADPVSRVLLKLQLERGSTRQKPPSFPTAEELEVLGELRDLLKPLEEATLIVSAAKTVTLSNVIPLVFVLKEKIIEYQPASAITFNVKNALLREVEKNFAGVELFRPYAAANMLDPRYKKWVFESPQAAANIIHHLSKRISDKINASGRALQEEALHRRGDDNIHNPPTGIWAALDQRIRERSVGISDQEATVSIPSQLKAYLANPPLDRIAHPNPLETWEAMRSGLEHVHDLAMEYLPVVATSVSAERLFSHAGLISTQLRNRLLPENLNQLVFLRSVEKTVWFR